MRQNYLSRRHYLNSKKRSRSPPPAPRATRIVHDTSTQSLKTETRNQENRPPPSARSSSVVRLGTVGAEGPGPLFWELTVERELHYSASPRGSDTICSSAPAPLDRALPVVVKKTLGCALSHCLVPSEHLPEAVMQPGILRNTQVFLLDLTL